MINHSQECTEAQIIKRKRGERIPNVFSFKMHKTQRKEAGFVDYTNIKSKNLFRERKKLVIPVETIIQNLVYPPSVAAENIGISISTLRRRFAEFRLEGHSWPITELEFENKRKDNREVNKGSLQDVINSTSTDCCTLDSFTEIILKCAFKANAEAIDCK
jgi:hypothetical protein